MVDWGYKSRTNVPYNRFNKAQVKKISQTLQSERQKREEMVEWAEREVYALSETLKKSKEMVSVGHKKVYNHIKIVSELKGRLEVWEEILQALTQPTTPLTNDKE